MLRQNQATQLQVLISIQSMILVSDPYYNEPGYESSRGTTSGNQQCENYNRQQECNTACHSILAALRQPDPCFQEIIRLIIYTACFARPLFGTCLFTGVLYNSASVNQQCKVCNRRQEDDIYGQLCVL